MAKNIVTDKELNKIFPCLSLWTINQLRRQGKIPHIKLPGTRRYFFDVEAVEQWLEKLQTKCCVDGLYRNE